MSHPGTKRVLASVPGSVSISSAAAATTATAASGTSPQAKVQSSAANKCPLSVGKTAAASASAGSGTGSLQRQQQQQQQKQQQQRQHHEQQQQQPDADRKTSSAHPFIPSRLVSRTSASQFSPGRRGPLAHQVRHQRQQQQQEHQQLPYHHNPAAAAAAFHALRNYGTFPSFVVGRGRGGPGRGGFYASRVGGDTAFGTFRGRGLGSGAAFARRGAPPFRSRPGHYSGVPGGSRQHQQQQQQQQQQKQVKSLVSTSISTATSTSKGNSRITPKVVNASAHVTQHSTSAHSSTTAARKTQQQELLLQRRIKEFQQQLDERPFSSVVASPPPIPKSVAFFPSTKEASNKASKQEVVKATSEPSPEQKKNVANPERERKEQKRQEHRNELQQEKEEVIPLAEKTIHPLGQIAESSKKYEEDSEENDEESHVCQLHNDTLNQCLDTEGVYLCKAFSPRCYIIQKVSKLFIDCLTLLRQLQHAFDMIMIDHIYFCREKNCIDYFLSKISERK